MSQTIVITGGSSGIGKLLREHFEARGDVVCSLSRTDPDRIKHHCPCDVRSEEDIVAALTAAHKQFGAFDMLICNAGIGISGALEHLPAEKVREVMDINFMGGYLTMKHGLKYMKQGGRIVAVSSAASLFALPFREIYCAGKSALSMASIGLGLETDYVKTITICPGEISTPFTINRARYYDTDEKYGDRIKNAADTLDKGVSHRMTPELAAGKIVKIITKKRPKRFYIVGAKVKFFYIMSKLLPTNLYIKMTGKVYGGKKVK